MTTKTLTGTYTSGYLLTSPITSLSIATTGYVEGEGVFTSSTATTAYTVINDGRIVGNPGTNGHGVYFYHGGSVINGSPTVTGAEIQGWRGIESYNASATVTNYGTVIGNARSGVFLDAGGLITNGSGKDTGALIEGGSASITLEGAGAVVNFATISGPNGDAVQVLYVAGDKITNGSASDTKAEIRGASAGVVFTDAGTVSNFGMITATNIDPSARGVDLGGGVVTNGAKALISGYSGVTAVGVCSVANLGTIEGFGSAAGDGVYAFGGSAITNGSAGNSKALIEGYVGVEVGPGVAGTVTNFGSIGGTSQGVYLEAGGSLTNAGTITGGGADHQFAVHLAGAGSVKNGSATDTTAQLSGHYTCAVYGVGTVANFASIQASGIGRCPGVFISGGGSVTNGSSSDTTSQIYGHYGVVVYDVATVVNFGSIRGSGSAGGIGVAIDSGTVTNGAVGDTTALIEALTGVVVVDPGTIANDGTIASLYGAGVGFITGAGSLTNGAVGDYTALMEGIFGVYVEAASALTAVNLGTILGLGGVSSDGFNVVGTLDLTNGGTKNTNALIDGGHGVSISGTGTVTNFGTIQGIGGVAVLFSSASDRLIVEAGSTWIGAVQGGSGMLELAGGIGTITGLGATGTLSGAEAMTFSGFGSYDFDARGNWTLTGKSTVAGSLINAGSLTLADKASLTIQGAVDNSGSISLAGAKAATNLIVGAVGVTLSGGGSVVLGGSTFDKVTGATVSATLTNDDNTISGGGALGAGKLVLVNAFAGVIDQTGAVALTINTAAKTITNAGTMEATGAGGMTIASAVTNTGVLEADGGNLTLDHAVSGTGMAKIIGGILDAVSTFTQNVTFAGPNGELELGHSQTYTGAVTGFSKTGATSLDLVDIGFVSPTEATFSGTTTSGILTVTDGTHTAKITLIGNYRTSTFTCSSDGHGGVTIVDPTSSLVAPASLVAPIHAFISAVAAFGAGGVGSIRETGQPWRTAVPVLAGHHGSAA